MTADLTAQLRDDVKTWLRQGHVTQRTVAATLGLSEKHVSGVLSGKAPLSLALAQRMLALTGRELILATRPVPGPGPLASTADDGRVTVSERVLSALRCEDAARRILEIHAQIHESATDETWKRSGWCGECGGRWPCATVRALTEQETS